MDGNEDNVQQSTSVSHVCQAAFHFFVLLLPSILKYDGFSSTMHICIYVCVYLISVNEKQSKSRQENQPHTYIKEKKKKRNIVCDSATEKSVNDVIKLNAFAIIVLKMLSSTFADTVS